MKTSESKLGEKKFIPIPGNSESIQKINKQLILLSGLSRDAKVEILIEGESGVGKSQAAEIIHKASGRTGEFITLSVFREDSIISDLFGHIRGAFTSAHVSRSGAIKQATNGTLFLDEIGDMPEKTQSILLTLLDNRSYRQMGCDETRKAKTSFIFATNRDLRKLRDEGQFRNDLYQRLNVVSLRLPPLRERGDDINEWINIFFEKNKNLFSSKSKNLFEQLKCDFKDNYFNYAWPGNLRELENRIKETLIFRQTIDKKEEHISCRSTPITFKTQSYLGEPGSNLKRQTIGDIGFFTPQH